MVRRLRAATCNLIETSKNGFQKKKGPTYVIIALSWLQTEVVFKQLVSEEVRLRCVGVGIEGISQL